MSQLLHEEDFEHDGQPYRLSVYRADGGIVGKWFCATCQSRNDHTDPVANIDGCLGRMKHAICEHHTTAHGPAE